ncbi:MAG: chemotaxis-specific protein-glutamate methyltransferase CheB [Leptospirales bacterium]|nr:chemotaxis-specific protein-glutamate methyltransferase CheB [Leptospirales bacterium]
MSEQASDQIRVMIVDDSQAYRNLLRHELALDPRIEVVSVAANGRLALPRINHYRPDFVILDLEMPEMDGLATLEVVKKKWPDTRVVMFSSHTVEGARLTLRALELGAIDFVPKPTGLLDVSGYLRNTLIKRIKDLARTKTQPVPVVPAPTEVSLREEVGQADICAIGISTGGPNALRELLARITPPLRGPIVIVQHMPPLFTKHLAETLSYHTRLTVVEASDGMRLEAGMVVIAPGGSHLELVRGAGAIIARTNDRPPELSCKPSVNILFRSVALEFGNRALALIMTGMGEDGYEGVRDIRNRGGFVYAQSPESCVVFGMPERPIREHLALPRDIPGLAFSVQSRLGMVK